jgi:hypothetical protein
MTCRAAICRWAAGCWRDSHPVAYLSLAWRWGRPLGAGRFSLNPRAFYYTDDGLGSRPS